MVAGQVAEAVRRTAEPGHEPPTAAAPHAVRARFRPLRVVRGRIRVIPPVAPILAPLPYVPVHVVQPPSIRFLIAYRMGLIVRVLPIPSIFFQLLFIVPEAIASLAPCPINAVFGPISAPPPVSCQQPPYDPLRILS